MAPGVKRILKIASLIVIIFVFLLISLVYFGLTKVVVAELSEKATTKIGQKVTIGDLSFSLTSGIHISYISIENPENFVSGHLLRIERLSLNMKFTDLLRGGLSFKNIIVYSPELNVVRDRYGNINISDRLMLFLSKKSTRTFRIENFTIDSGNFQFNNDERGRIDAINLHLSNLSSDKGTKTFIKGHTSYAGGNRINIDGWAYLSDEPKKYNISVSSGDFSLSAFKTFFNRYDINTEKTKLNFNITTEGDMENGFGFKSEIRIKDAEISLFKEKAKETIVNINAFFRTRDNSIIVNNVSLDGDSVALRFKAVVADVINDPSYRAELTIKRIDLSAFNFNKDLKTSGIITSDSIHINGIFRKTEPSISGTVQLRDAVIMSHDVSVEKMNGRLELSSDRGISVKGEARAKIQMAGGYLFDKPSDIELFINTRREPEKITLSSSASLSPFIINVKENKPVYSDGINVALDGTFRGMDFSGKGFLEIKGVRYADHTISRLTGSSGIEYRRNLVTIKDLKVETENLTSSISQITIKIPEKKNIEYSVDVKGINAQHHREDVELAHLDLHAKLNRNRESISGNFDFSIKKVKFYDIKSGLISGSGRFDEKEFSVDILQGEISGGRMKFSTKGRASGGPFPLKINASAENIEVTDISKALSRFSEIPYRISGLIKNASFMGNIHSKKFFLGSASVKAEKISVLKTGTEKNILKDISLNSTIISEGSDLEFKADANTGNVSMRTSGKVERFMEKDRAMKIKAHVPTVKVTDIRVTFWEIFPDSFLYAGLGGYISSDVLIDITDSRLKINGEMVLNDVMLEGENGEYYAGPINGVIPLVYDKTGEKEKPVMMPSFDRSGFDNLSAYYSEKLKEDSLRRITIGSLHYGFKFLENIDVWVKQDDSVLNIRQFSGNIFGGRMNGSFMIDVSDGFVYRGGILLEGLSLTKLCEGIEPIKGYISGRVNGVASFKGSGLSISNLIGKADFWTYSTSDDETKISREFLHKIGGPSLKAYIGDRRFDKGIMSLYLQNGFIIFKELEISNRNILGITDLSVKVAPLSNRIAFDHLMWTITEAAQRAQEKQ